MDGVTVVFVAVVGARFLVPLWIPRFPLVAVLACLVLDAVDQTVFQTFGYDPPGYQGYDKAMDVYYLAIAFLATMRNWWSMPAFRIAWFLYFYRLVGVVAFELSQVRALLLVFPNTFEYFFIAYEGVRTRWSPLRFGFRWWLWAAGLIWVVVKLPQEWWIHIAQLDFTDFVRDHDWVLPLLVVLAVAAGLVLWFVVRPRLASPDWDWRFAADPLPEEMDEAAERAAWTAERGAVWSGATLEKVVLLGLLSVIFAQTLPDVRSTDLQLFLGVAVVVVVNAAITLAAARRRWVATSLVIAFAARMVANIVLVVLAHWLLNRSDGDLHVGNTLFFLTMISLITTLHDAWRPVHAVRAEQAAAPVG